MTLFIHMQANPFRNIACFCYHTELKRIYKRYYSQPLTKGGIFAHKFQVNNVCRNLFHNRLMAQFGHYVCTFMFFYSDFVYINLNEFFARLFQLNQFTLEETYMCFAHTLFFDRFKVCRDKLIGKK